MKYYRLTDDINYPNRWYLGDVRGVNNWDFRRPEPSVFERSCYEVEVYQDGEEMDFTLTGAFGVVVVSEPVKRLFEKKISEAKVRFIAAHIVGKAVRKSYYIMVILRHIDAVDQERSDFTRYEENDPVRPDLAGKYSGFYDLFIDDRKAEGEPIFRIKDGDVVIIASETVRKAFEEEGIAADFQPAC